MQSGKRVQCGKWLGGLGISAAVALSAMPASAEPIAPAATPDQAAPAAVHWEDRTGTARPFIAPNVYSGAGAPQRDWYGWQILIPGIASDLVTTTSLFVLSNGPPELFFTLFLTGLAGHGLSGPIVHLAHGNWGKAAGSFALEAGLPAISLTLIATSKFDFDYGGNWEQFLIGYLSFPIMMTAGLAIDSAVLAYDPVTPKHTRKTLPVTGLSLAPLFVPPLRRAPGGENAAAERRFDPKPVGMSLAGQF